MAITLRELVTKWSFDVQQAPLKRAERSIKNIQRLARNTALLAAGNALGLGAFFKILNQFQQAEISFEVLIGNLERSKVLIRDLEQFARVTPFTLTGVNEAAKGLLAFRFEAEEIIPTLRAVGNIAAGVGTDKLGRLILALGQVRTAGRLRGQELRQFTEAGVGLVAALAELTGKTDKEIADLVPKGEISFELVAAAIKKVATGTGRFAGLMERQSKSLGGIFTNIIDTIQLSVKAVGKAGFLGQASKFLQDILNLLEVSQTEIIEVLSGALTGLIVLARTLGGTFLLVGRIFKAVTAIFGGMERAMTLLAIATTAFIGLRLAFLVGTIAQAWTAYALAARAAGVATLFVQAAAIAIPIAIALAIASLLLIAEDIIGFFEGKDSVTGRIINAFKDLAKFFSAHSFFGPLLEDIKTVNDVFENLIKLMAFGATKTDKLAASIKSLSKEGGGLRKLVVGGGQGVNEAIAAPVTPGARPIAGKDDRPLVNIIANINANGLNAAEAQVAIEQGLEGALDKVLRGARRDVPSQSIER